MTLIFSNIQPNRTSFLELRLLILTVFGNNSGLWLRLPRNILNGVSLT